MAKPEIRKPVKKKANPLGAGETSYICLLYTSDAADDIALV